MYNYKLIWFPGFGQQSPVIKKQNKQKTINYYNY